MTTGTWDPLAYAVDAGGVPLVLFGSADPDDAAYALNANTGAEVWRFQTTNMDHDYDIGSGITISPPRVNGFADGVAYVPAKDGFVSPSTSRPATISGPPASEPRPGSRTRVSRPRLWTGPTWSWASPWA